ncbi:MAG: phosphonate ABC transporter, permease protein PhnE [Bacilli bacterium]|nr:phosphonate ABC transporter, permease protein PhnE [Bacilli bacterium]MBN2876284.1 phosphonate ABC transporter, permease protein PhnE [Bacilli bacterium]
MKKNKQNLGKFFQTIGKGFRSLVNLVWQGITSFFRLIGRGFQLLGRFIWKYLYPVIKFIWKYIGPIVMFIWKYLGPVVRFIWKFLKPVLLVFKRIFIPDPIKTEKDTVVLPPKPIMPYILIIFTIVFIMAIKATDFSLTILISRLMDFQLGPVAMIQRFFPVDWAYWTYVVDPILETIQMSFLGSLIGSVLALPAAYLASQNLTKSKAVVNITRFILSVFRTLPILIYAFFFKMIFYLGPLPGTIAIALFTFSIVAKMLYERIEVLDLGAYHAIQSTGASKQKAFLTALMPPILPIFYSISLYAFEINIRYAAILGYVGAGGIGFDLDKSMKNLTQNDRILVILIFIFATVVIIENTSRFLRRRVG